MNNKTIKQLILPLFIILLISYFFYSYVYNPYVYIAKNGTKYHTSNSPYYQAYPKGYTAIRLKEAQKLHYEPCQKN